MALSDFSTPRRKAPAVEVVTRTRLPRQNSPRTPGCCRGVTRVEVGADELRIRHLLHRLEVVL